MNYVSKNFTGTAKAIEAHGVLQNILNILENTNRTAYISE